MEQDLKATNEYSTLKHVIVVIGESNRGKTTILKNVASEFNLETDKTSNDILVYGKYKGINVGICTAGDDQSYINRAFDLVKSHNIEILIMALSVVNPSRDMARSPKAMFENFGNHVSESNALVHCVIMPNVNPDEVESKIEKYADKVVETFDFILKK